MTDGRIIALAKLVANGSAGDPVTPSDATPQGLGTATPGTSANYSRADHVHPVPTQIVTNVVAMSAGVIDVSAGMVFAKTITADTTISFSNVPANPAATCVTLILANGGAYTVTWPSSVKWNGGTAPDLTASGADVLTFLIVGGGTTCYGTVNSLGAA